MDGIQRYVIELFSAFDLTTLQGLEEKVLELLEPFKFHEFGYFRNLFQEKGMNDTM